MKLFHVLRQARRLTLQDVQELSGINVATLSMFENGLLTLTEDQKVALHSLFPNRKKEELFADLDLGPDRSGKSIFRPRKLTPAQKAKVDADVKNFMERDNVRIEKEREELRAKGKEAVKKRYDPSFF